jgi:nitrogen regulatory protein PII
MMPSAAVLILHDLSRFDEVVAAWHEAGAPAVTIVDAMGTRDPREQAQRDDLPLMPSIRDLLQSGDAPRRVVVALVEDAAVDALVDATEQVLGDLREDGNGLLFIVPVSRAVGLRRPGGG